MSGSLDFYIFLAVATLIAILGFVIFLHGPREKTNRFFSIFVISLLFWMISNYAENTASDIHLAKFFLIFDFAIGSITVLAFLLLCLAFIDSSRIEKHKYNILFFIFPIVFAIIPVIDDIFIRNVRFGREGRLIFDFGPAYWFYAAYVFLYAGIGIYFLINHAILHKGEERKKVFIILLGLGLFSSTTLVINIFMQNILPVSFFYFGLYSVIFIVGFISYAIIRHNLFNIRIFAAEAIVTFIIVVSIVQMLGSKSTPELFPRFLYFLVIMVFGFMLIWSVFQEVKRREAVERLSRELVVANEKLRELDKIKTDFLSIASHQLRSPLTVIKLGSLVLLDGTFGKLAEKPKIAVRKIFESSERLINLVNDFLNISRIELGKIEYNFAQTDFVALVKEVAEELKVKAAEKKLKLICQFPQGEQSPPLTMDDEKIRQVVLNLIDNAIKYTEKGEVVCKVEWRGREMFFCVKDTGCGLGSEETKIIFEKFRRGGTTSSRERVEGSGFGLFVAKTFIEAHGGKIWAESEGENQGSAFCFTLPIKEQ